MEYGGKPVEDFIRERCGLNVSKRSLFEVKKPEKLTAQAAQRRTERPRCPQDTHTFPEEEKAVAALIKQRRIQMLIHSCLYYHFDAAIVSDMKFDQWAQELVVLQTQHPEIAAKVIFAEAFKDWDGSTGYHLPLKDEWVMFRAADLLRCEEQSK